MDDDFSLPVYKSLMKSELLMGIPKIMFVIILIVTILFMYMISGYCFVIFFVFWFPTYLISKKDPDLFPILIESLQEPDFLEG